MSGRFRFSAAAVSSETAASVEKSETVETSRRTVAESDPVPKFVTRTDAESVEKPMPVSAAVPTGAPGGIVENSMGSVVSSTSSLFTTMARAK